MKYAGKIATIVFLLICIFASSSIITVHASSEPSDWGVMEMVLRMMDDFEALLVLHEMLEILTIEERNTIGSTMMVSMQGKQIVQQQIQALSEGRLFMREARGRYEFNRAISSEENGMGHSGFIHGQRNFPQSELQIGNAGNGGDHGCGPISVHNILFSLYSAGIINEAPCIAEIIHRLDIMGGFILGGEIGTNPETMVQLLQNKGHSTIINYLPTDLDTAIRQSAAQTAILLYIGQAAPYRSAYWHYITIRYIDSRFELYNVGVRDLTIRTTNSVDDWARSRAVLALITLNSAT